MTKSELVDRLCQSQKLPHARAELLVETVFETMVAAMKRGERIEIRGLGSFELREYGAYEGRNPRTGNIVPVQGKRLPFFKVGKELKDRVNAAAQPVAVALGGPRPRLAGGSAASSKDAESGEEVLAIETALPVG